MHMDGLVALEKVLDQPFWKRVWIFQEIVLGTQGPFGYRCFLQIGRTQFPWGLFAIGIQSLWGAIVAHLRASVNNVKLSSALGNLCPRIQSSWTLDGVEDTWNGIVQSG